MGANAPLVLLLWKNFSFKLYNTANKYCTTHNFSKCEIFPPNLDLNITMCRNKSMSGELIENWY